MLSFSCLYLDMKQFTTVNSFVERKKYIICKNEFLFLQSKLCKTKESIFWTLRFCISFIKQSKRYKARVILLTMIENTKTVCSEEQSAVFLSIMKKKNMRKNV